VAITNIPEAFLHAEMNINVHMLLEETIAALIVKLEPRLYHE